MDSEKNDEIKVICKNIEQALQKLDWSIEEIQKRAEVAVPLLKHLENILRQFRIPVQIIVEEIKLIQQQKVYNQYQQVFNDFMKKSYDGKNKDGKGKLVKQMMKLIKEACYNQLQLDTILETPKKLCKILKDKGRKILSYSSRKVDQKKLLEFASKLIKQDFIFTHLNNIQPQIIVDNIKILESQKKIINEIRKQPMFLSGIDEIKILDEKEFKQVTKNWLKSIVEINELLQNKVYQAEFLEYKKQFLVSVFDLRKFSQKLWEFQKFIIDFQKLIALTKKLNVQVQKICFKEFMIRVEISFDDIQKLTSYDQILK